jgi:hypothetical protein
MLYYRPPNRRRSDVLDQVLHLDHEGSSEQGDRRGTSSAREMITPSFQAAVPYLLQSVLGLIAVLALIKDWADYGKASGKYKSPVRVLVLVLTVAVTALSLLDTYNSRSESARKDAESRNRSMT